jgi:hypothetical protein
VKSDPTAKPPLEDDKIILGELEVEEPSVLTPTYARQFWVKNGRPTFRQLADMLTKKGYPVNAGTLCRWKNKDSLWFRLMEEAEHAIAPEVIIRALNQAEKDGRQLRDTAYSGIKARLVARLYETISVIPLETIEEWHKAFAGIALLDGLIHTARGNEISKDADKPAGGSVIHAFEPKVPVPKFGKG